MQPLYHRKSAGLVNCGLGCVGLGETPHAGAAGPVNPPQNIRVTVACNMQYYPYELHSCVADGSDVVLG